MGSVAVIKPKKTAAPAVAAVGNPLNVVVPGSNKANFNDKIVVIKQDYFSPKFADKDRRMYTIGGFGCHPDAMGKAVFGKFLLDGEPVRLSRYDIEGLAAVTN